MTYLGAWALTGSREQFQQGAAAFRNGRDWAKERRDEFISIANMKKGSSSLESTRYSRPSETEKTCLVEDSETSVDELALSPTLMPYPVEDSPHPNNCEILADALSFTKDAKPTDSNKRPASRISRGTSSNPSKTKKVCRR